ncbi:MAG: hypothetical protein E7544_07955 [Ruminococcaceae bacterium]|nr:hypothetical protein [Oscillospiraceae bacterium]
MSNTKKIVSIVMAVAMIFNIFAIIATAADPAADPADYSVDVAFSTPKLEVYPGETFTVTMTVGTNCYLGGLTLPIYFSKSVFETEGNVELAGSLAGYASITSSVPVADAIVWPKKLNGSTVTTSLKKQYSAVMINAYADRNVGTQAAVLDPAEQTINVEFTVAETATVGSTGVIMLEGQALKSSSASTNPMTAYAYKTADISLTADALVSMLNMTVDNAKLTFEVIDKPVAAPADLAGLRAAIQATASVLDSNASQYIQETWTRFYNARTDAKELLAMASRLTVEDQERVDNAAAELTAAFKALELIQDESDYTSIYNALEKVPSEYELKFYTEASVNVLQLTIDNIPWNLTPDRQPDIDAYAELILTNIAALVPDESRAAAEAKITFDSYEGEAGDTVNVSVNLGTNYYVESLSIPVFFDNTYFELVPNTVSFANSTLAKNGWLNYNLNPGDAIYNRTDPNDTTWSPIWANEANRAKYSALLFTWVQDSTVCEDALEANIEEAFVTFQLKVKDNAPDGDAKVFLCESFIKDAAYKGGIFFVTRDLDASALNVSATQPVGQTYVLSEAEATYVIGAELEAPALVASAGSTTVIDKSMAGTYVINGVATEINGYVYGLMTDLFALDGFVEATNEGTVRVTPVDGFFSVGTGTLIEVVRDDVVYETYVVIIFGDINGDAAVDLIDATMADDYASYLGEDFNDFQLFASDIADKGFTDLLDAVAIDSYANYYGDIDQVTGMFTE